jgi:hypothetical protein
VQSVHASLKTKQLRCIDGRTLEIISSSCMRNLGLRFISKVDGWCKVAREVVEGLRGPIVMIVETIQCKVD